MAAVTYEVTEAHIIGQTTLLGATNPPLGITTSPVVSFTLDTAAIAPINIVLQTSDNAAVGAPGYVELVAQRINAAVVAAGGNPIAVAARQPVPQSSNYGVALLLRAKGMKVLATTGGIAAKLGMSASKPTASISYKLRLIDKGAMPDGSNWEHVYNYVLQDVDVTSEATWEAAVDLDVQRILKEVRTTRFAPVPILQPEDLAPRNADGTPSFTRIDQNW